MKNVITKTTMRERIETERARLLATNDAYIINEAYVEYYGKGLKLPAEQILENLQRVDRFGERHLIDFCFDTECWICRKLLKIDETIVIMSFEDEDWEYGESSIFHLVCLHKI